MQTTHPGPLGSPLPLVEEISTPELSDAFRRASTLPHCLWLDSAMSHPTLGRYSFLAADPFAWIELAADGSNALGQLQAALAAYPALPIPGLPPFQGGAAGLLGYELRHSTERLPEAPFNELTLPALAVGLYDVVAAVDHVARRAWIISHGWPEREPEPQRRRAIERLEEMRALLAGSAEGKGAGPLPVAPRPLSAPRYPISGWPGLLSNFSPEGYLAAVRRVIDYITAGDVFQVNLAQQLALPAWTDAASLYLQLRSANPAPFAGYFDLGTAQIVSASPERFLQLAGDRVETRPIKGTRRRSGTPADEAMRRQLIECEKDRAENIMIVDLLRNDLSRVCRAESVEVSELCAVEDYEHVMHLVSAVTGQLRPGLGAVDLLRACFPGGSITGAPKIRAMEIISELEPTARGAYCGSLGYLGFDGSMDVNLLIRTITAASGWWHFAVGGGIVAQSDPTQEYDETWAKAEGLLRAMCGDCPDFRAQPLERQHENGTVPFEGTEIGPSSREAQDGR